MEIKELTVQELKEMQDKGEDFELIDVRKKDEFDYCQMGGKLIPMQEMQERFSEIPKDKKVVVHCHHGGRSKKVIAWMQDYHGYENLYNLNGGIHAWSEQINTDVPIY